MDRLKDQTPPRLLLFRLGGLLFATDAGQVDAVVAVPKGASGEPGGPDEPPMVEVAGRHYRVIELLATQHPGHLLLHEDDTGPFAVPVDEVLGTADGAEGECGPAATRPAQAGLPVTFIHWGHPVVLVELFRLASPAARESLWRHLETLCHDGSPPEPRNGQAVAPIGTQAHPGPPTGFDPRTIIAKALRPSAHNQRAGANSPPTPAVPWKVDPAPTRSPEPIDLPSDTPLLAMTFILPALIIGGVFWWWAPWEPMPLPPSAPVTEMRQAPIPETSARVVAVTATGRAPDSPRPPEEAPRTPALPVAVSTDEAAADAAPPGTADTGPLPEPTAAPLPPTEVAPESGEEPDARPTVATSEGKVERGAPLPPPLTREMVVHVPREALLDVATPPVEAGPLVLQPGPVETEAAALDEVEAPEPTPVAPERPVTTETQNTPPAPAALPHARGSALPIAPCPPCRFEYRVMRGDTLWSIAQRFLKDPYRFTALAEASGVEDPSRIRAGDRIIIQGH
jgi:nucleoid-associated protein YgaU